MSCGFFFCRRDGYSLRIIVSCYVEAIYLLHTSTKFVFTNRLKLNRRDDVKISSKYVTCSIPIYIILTYSYLGTISFYIVNIYIWPYKPLYEPV